MPRLRAPIQSPPGVSYQPFGVQSMPNPRLRDVVEWMRKFAHQNKAAMRPLVEEICRDVAPGDYASEALAIYHWVCKNIRYMRDVQNVEYLQQPTALLKTRAGDCLPSGTLLLTSDYQFVPIERLTAGQEIWGLDAWTRVERVWSKGVLPVVRVRLNNGSSFLATKDHKLYAAKCRRHKRAKAPCSCPVSARDVERVTVGEATPDMVLLTPERIAFGHEPMDPRVAWIEGLFASDGWMSHGNCFAIAGKDGHPKEAQKLAVQAACRDMGIKTRLHPRFITVNAPEWAQRTARMGHHAPEKRVLSIGVEEAAARELLRGIMADSGANTNGSGRTFTTTSPELMLQTRVLQKMCGVSCGQRYLVDHGGLGTNPIWRLNTRMPRADGRVNKLLRVESVEDVGLSAPVWDLTTEDHYVYLPEADVTVSNCDDIACLIASMLMACGNQAAFTLMGFSAAPVPSHVFCSVLTPNGPVPLDPVANRQTAAMFRQSTHKLVVPV